jgi:hypothetical protein
MLGLYRIKHTYRDAFQGSSSEKKNSQDDTHLKYYSKKYGTLSSV